jgi:hypothetical protein
MEPLVGLFNNRELSDRLTHVDVIRTENEYPEFTFYFGVKAPHWFIHGFGEDIIITYGTQKINLGKFIDEIKEISIRCENLVNEAIIIEFEVNWLESNYCPISFAAFKTNKKMAKMLVTKEKIT